LHILGVWQGKEEKAGKKKKKKKKRMTLALKTNDSKEGEGRGDNVKKVRLPAWESKGLEKKDQGGGKLAGQNVSERNRHHGNQERTRERLKKNRGVSRRQAPSENLRKKKESNTGEKIGTCTTKRKRVFR